MGQERFCHFCQKLFDAGRADGYGFAPVVHEACGHISTFEGDLGTFEPDDSGGGTAHWNGPAAEKYLRRIKRYE